MKLNNVFLLGLIVFPVLVVLGAVLHFVSNGDVNALFWMVIPSVVFEELFESCCFEFSNCFIFNSLFVFLFWYFTGILISWIFCNFKTLLKKRKFAI